MGLDHCMVGKMIGEKWQFSDTLIELLGCHHSPGEASEASKGLVAIVALANMYANLNHIGSAGDQHPEEEQLKMLLDDVSIDWQELTALNETVQAEIEKAQVFLTVAKEVL